MAGGVLFVVEERKLGGVWRPGIEPGANVVSGVLGADPRVVAAVGADDADRQSPLRLTTTGCAAVLALVGDQSSVR